MDHILNFIHISSSSSDFSTGYSFSVAFIVQHSFLQLEMYMGIMIHQGIEQKTARKRRDEKDGRSKGDSI